MISIVIPSKNRPDKLKESVDAIISNASSRGNVEIIIGVEEGDFVTSALCKAMHEEGMIDKITELCAGEKLVKKYNKLNSVSSGDYVVGLSDDTIMMTKDFDILIESEYEKIPDKMLFLIMNDAPDSVDLFRHIVVSREIIDAMGTSLYPEEYAHFYTDNMLTALCRVTGRFVYMKDLVLDHRHPALNNGETKVDALHLSEYNENWENDSKVFNSEQRDKILNRMLEKFNSAVKDQIKVDNKLPPAPKIMLGVPCYGGMLHIDLLMSILEIQAQQLGHVYAIGNESLITRARNTIFSQFMRNPEYTHLLFIDADVYVSGADIRKMLSKRLPVIGAPVRLKARRKVFNVCEIYEQRQDGMMRVGNVGTAVLMFDRATCELLAAEAEKEGAVYDGRSVVIDGTDEEKRAMKFWDVFRVGVRDEIYKSEDYWVTNQLHKMGIPIWVDTTVQTRHNGTVALGSHDPD